MKEIKDILSLKFIEFNINQIISNLFIAFGFISMVLVIQYITSVN